MKRPSVCGLEPEVSSRFLESKYPDEMIQAVVAAIRLLAKRSDFILIPACLCTAALTKSDSDFLPAIFLPAILKR